MTSIELNIVINQALLFFSVFGIMGIISFIITKKNAKIYELKHSIEDRKTITRDERLIERHLNSSSIKINGKNATLLKLSHMLKDKILTKQEFNILKNSLNI